MANALLVNEEEQNQKPYDLQKTARVTHKKQVYKFSIWNTITISI